MAAVNIRILVDAQALDDMVVNDPKKAGSQDNPQSIGGWADSDKYIQMIAKESYVISGEDRSELTIQVEVGANINWYIGTFDNNTAYTPIIYKGVFNPGDGMSPMEFISMQTEQYLPPGTDPLAPVQPYTCQVARSSVYVVKTGQKIQYTFTFKLVDNSKNRTVGYFYWDPFIFVRG